MRFAQFYQKHRTTHYQRGRKKRERRNGAGTARPACSGHEKIPRENASRGRRLAGDVDHKSASSPTVARDARHANCSSVALPLLSRRPTRGTLRATKAEGIGIGAATRTSSAAGKGRENQLGPGATPHWVCRAVSKCNCCEMQKLSQHEGKDAKRHGATYLRSSVSLFPFSHGPHDPRRTRTVICRTCEIVKASSGGRQARSAKRALGGIGGCIPRKLFETHCKTSARTTFRRTMERTHRSKRRDSPSAREGVRPALDAASGRLLTVEQRH